MSRLLNTKRNTKKETLHGPSNTILFITVILAVLGLVMIFDASVYRANEYFSNQYYFIQQQAFWLFFGTIAATFMYFISYKWLIKISPILVTGMLILLLVTIIVSNAVNGAKGWFALTESLAIQPTEFFKLVFILFSAFILGVDHNRENKDFTIRKVLYLFITGIALILTLLQPDFGSAMIIALVALAIFFISDSSRKHTLITMGITLGGLLLGVIASMFARYRVARLSTWLEILLNGDVENRTKDGYQMFQILIGIGSGGLLGKGFGQSRQRFGFLPENTAFTDSIIAVYLEEFGLVGGILFIGLWLILLWKGISIARKLEDSRARILFLGIIIWLVGQTFVNIGVNVGLIPFTGITIPLISYGGSSTIVTMMAIGLLLNLSRYTNESKDTR